MKPVEMHSHSTLYLPSLVCPLVVHVQNNRHKLLLVKTLKCAFPSFFFCLSGPDISADQEDHFEDSSHLLPHGHCDRVSHGDCDGGKTLVKLLGKSIDCHLLLHSETHIFFFLFEFW